MNICILYYDEYNKNNFVSVARSLNDVIEDDNTKIIAIPKNYDLLLNCSVDQLVSVRALIDTALSLKIQAEQQQNVSDKDTTKIIDIRDYLS